MSLVQCLPNCACRRRTIISRLLPILLQIILILVIWQIVKSSMTADNSTKDLSKREFQNSASNDPSQCLFAKFSQAQQLASFNISSILSSSNPLQNQGKGGLLRHLLVDVYVRKSHNGTVFFYPAGTPVTIDQQGDNKNQDAEYDYSNNFLKHYTHVEKNVHSTDDRATDNVHSIEQQHLVANPKSLASLQNDNHQSEFRFRLRGNNERDVSVDGQMKDKKDLMLSHTLMTGLEGHGALGLTGSRNYEAVQYQNNYDNTNQRSMQKYQSHQDMDPLVNTNNVNVHLSPNEKLRMNDPNHFQHLSGENSLQNDDERVFDRQEHHIPNRNLVQADDNQIHPRNLQQPSYIQQWRAEGLHDQQNPDMSSDAKRWRDAGSNSQHNPQIPFPVQQEASADSGNHVPIFNKPVPVDGNMENYLTEGYLDRAKKFVAELRGKPSNVDMSEDGRQPIHLHMNNQQACQGLGDVDLLYLVNSKPQSSDMRQRIRETFVKALYFQPSVVVHVFLVGKTTSINFQQSLHQEQQQFGDIVQGDFMDSIANATNKGLMGMRWVTQFCAQVKFIMIINEDVFVDTEKLIHGLIPAVEKVANEKVMLCYFNPESPIPRSGPNAIAENLFPGRTNLRPYCKGFAILTTGTVISSLLAASEHTPLIVIDELYLYGILPFVAGGIDVYDVGNKRAFNNFGMETVSCYQQHQDTCPFVASVAFSERFTILWDIVKNRMQQAHPGWAGDRSLWNIEGYLRKF